ncbi:MAG: acetyltransferase [uncultured Clostridium sp.]
MKKDIIVIGCGGHSKVIVDAIEQIDEFRIKGYLDDNKYGKGYRDYDVLDKIMNVGVYDNENTWFVIAIGDNNIRKCISNSFPNLKYATIIHKNASISPSSTIGFGSVVLDASIINADSKIGSHVIINTRSIVEHDCVIGNYCHLSPGSIICGGNIVDDNVHIGANSVIIPCKVINKNSIIGAGSTVINSVEINDIVVGCPAKSIIDKK